MRTVLGIDVDDELVALWRGWFAPPQRLVTAPADISEECQVLCMERHQLR